MKYIKAPIKYNAEFHGKLTIETSACSTCGDVRDFIHVLY